jgi:probable HAF family extracellular repeat protein
MSKSIVTSLLLAASAVGAIAQQYEIARIAPLAGATRTYANDINARGQIVGFCEFGSGNSRAFVLHNESVIEISVPGEDTSAVAINDHGTVVGVSRDIFDEYHAFVWTPASGIRRLFPSRMESVASDINNAGDIVGRLDRKPFVIRDLITTILPTIYDTFSIATGINENGVIIGRDAPPQNEFPIGVRWVNDIPQQLSGGTGKWPSEINDSNQIVGSHWTYHIQTEIPVGWSGITMYNLPSLVGRGMGYGINNHGDKVGWVLDRNWQYGTAALWRGTKLVLLQLRISEPGWVLFSADRIAADGRILGSGRHFGDLSAYLLTPTK